MNNIFKFIIIGAAMTLSLSSCNDWLDVRPDTESKEKDQFASEKGFQTALTGCYMEMASSDAYGMRLTMSNIENLANLWTINKSTTRKDDYELNTHDYHGDNAKSAMKSIYSSLFRSISQANLIIKNAEAGSASFSSKAMRDVILGEAYAIRAYCQFDVLRIFGQVPQNATKTVKLPYSHISDISSLPAYYTFEEYAGLLKSDIEKAEALLKESDPAMTYSYSQMNYKNENAVNNEFLLYRQMRLNYWAVRALHARMALYTGDNSTASAIANELINAKLADGNAVRNLSGANDYKNGYLACPNECYFSLSKYDIKSVASAYFTLNDDEARYRAANQVLTTAQLTRLYQGENTAAHNRYLNLWNQSLLDASAKKYVGFKRYCFSDEASSKSIYYQIIPMLRVSEMYLIAIETATDLAKVNALYKDYMVSHNVTTMPDFTSLADVKKWITEEYRREFYGEGQMFYTYKRLGATSILWLSTAVNEETYIIPLPESEFDPSL